MLRSSAHRQERSLHRPLPFVQNVQNEKNGCLDLGRLEGAGLCSSMEELLRPKERVGGSSPSRGTVFFYSDQEFLLWSDRTEAVFARFLPHPTAALQAASGRLGMRRLPALFGCAVLLIEHDMSLICRDIHLAVPLGGITVLLGANGAGKSTLLDGIVGLAPLAAGEIWMGIGESMGCRSIGVLRRVWRMSSRAAVCSRGLRSRRTLPSSTVRAPRWRRLSRSFRSSLSNATCERIACRAGNSRCW